ncbi:hypothetical protein B0T22DRAFT_483457 [Podospora appendiculata]|uniref:Survival Motor Neuron Gemin2-binding domain-containing protein n=1 Tax=Podospora appendiculata TaxID=314037 RepID=A0AAE1C920_9PEZI|nr:hypothetical protein B0T22DRAFT_483457 [Podospora appendiculata]
MAAAHEEIWDDSALVESWNQALDEYKKYHSIHATGGTVADIAPADPKTVRWDAKPETDAADEPIEDGQVVEEGDETRPTPAREVDESASQQPEPGQAETPSGAGPAPAFGPQALLESVQDEDMKKLLMSWYYAGYYTGLVEGKQQAGKAPDVYDVSGAVGGVLEEPVPDDDEDDDDHGDGPAPSIYFHNSLK